MAIRKIQINEFICDRCEHAWITKFISSNKLHIPKQCPRCNTTLWNKGKFKTITTIKFRGLNLSKKQMTKLKNKKRGNRNDIK